MGISNTLDHIGFDVECLLLLNNVWRYILPTLYTTLYYCAALLEGSVPFILYVLPCFHWQELLIVCLLLMNILLSSLNLENY